MCEVDKEATGRSLFRCTESGVSRVSQRHYGVEGGLPQHVLQPIGQ